MANRGTGVDGAAPRRALITGVTGQDGSFLAELLLSKGYNVTGTVRLGGAGGSLGAAEHLRDVIEPLELELLDPASLAVAVKQTTPDELYHLAGPSFVPESWEHPAQTTTAIVGSAAALLEAVMHGSPHTRVFVASSGAIFGASPDCPQHEGSVCRPLNPYATAKLAAHQLVGQLRARAGLFACSGILYNHESERRPPTFVSRKITSTVAAIKRGFADQLELGDLGAVRDWSFAGDVVEGAWLMLQQPEPDDFILASGRGRTVEQFAEVAFATVGLDPAQYIRVDQKLVRAAEPTPLVGSASGAHERLGWTPRLDFEALVQRMVEADLRELDSRLRGSPPRAAPRA